jgi:hypothetical protein
VLERCRLLGCWPVGIVRGRTIPTYGLRLDGTTSEIGPALERADVSGVAGRAGVTSTVELFPAPASRKPGYDGLMFWVWLGLPAARCASYGGRVRVALVWQATQCVVASVKGVCCDQRRIG